MRSVRVLVVAVVMGFALPLPAQEQGDVFVVAEGYYPSHDWNNLNLGYKELYPTWKEFWPELCERNPEIGCDPRAWEQLATGTRVRMPPRTRSVTEPAALEVVAEPSPVTSAYEERIGSFANAIQEFNKSLLDHQTSLALYTARQARLELWRSREVLAYQLTLVLALFTILVLLITRRRTEAALARQVEVLEIAYALAVKHADKRKLIIRELKLRDAERLGDLEIYKEAALRHCTRFELDPDQERIDGKGTFILLEKGPIKDGVPTVMIQAYNQQNGGASAIKVTKIREKYRRARPEVHEANGSVRHEDALRETLIVA